MIDQRQFSRRAFLQGSTLLMAAGAAQTFAKDETPLLRIGLVTDLHYADKAPAGTRHYRETLDKLTEAAERFERERPDFVVELGDFIDAADSVETERKYLSTIQREFAQIGRERHYVLGNHCVDTLTKAEFLGGVEQDEAHYAFDRQGVRFIVLDACYRSDGEPYGRKNAHWTDANIPAAELEWVAGELQDAPGPAIVFAHQRLDVSNNHGVKNNAEVRQVLERSGKVLAVFQGHSHQNDHHEIGGIHYCTLAAMVEGSGAESNGYAMLDVYRDGTLKLHGFRRQADYRWS